MVVNRQLLRTRLRGRAAERPYRWIKVPKTIGTRSRVAASRPHPEEAPHGVRHARHQAARGAGAATDPRH